MTVKRGEFPKNIALDQFGKGDFLARIREGLGGDASAADKVDLVAGRILSQNFTAAAVA